MSNAGSLSSASAIFSVVRQKSSPSVHLLKAKRMSNAVPSVASTASISFFVKPLAFSASCPSAFDPASVPRPTA